MSGSRLTWLILRREVREGVRGRTFLVSSALVLLMLVVVIALPALIGDPRKEVKLGVVGQAQPTLVRALDRAAKPYGAEVKLRSYGDAAAALHAVAQRRVDAAIVPGGVLLVAEHATGNAAAVATAAVSSLELPARVQRLGLTPAQAAGLFAPALARHEIKLDAGGDPNAELLAYAGAIMLLLTLSVYGNAVLTGIVQEKSSRVVEVLLAVVEPRRLLAGKVVGIGVLGLAQLAVIALGGAVAVAVGAVDVPTLGRTAPLVLLWFLLGYALYAVAFAAVGALVSRVEDTTSAAMPVTMTMLVAYFATFVGVAGNPEGPAAVLLTLLPPSAPFALPARVAVTAVPLWQHVAAVAFMLAAIWGLVRLGGRMYEAGLLRTGARVPFREAFAAALRD